MGRWIAGAAVIAALGLAGSWSARPVAAAPGVKGLVDCQPGATCDLASLGHVFPNYQAVCPSEDCGVVAAADWVSVGAQVTVTPSALASIYSAMGRRPELGTNLSALWEYWSRSGLGGIYLFAHDPVALGESAVEAAIVASGAVLAVDRSGGSQLAADAGIPPGVTDVIADGFTPRGPLVVFEHQTVQLTWRQWRAQIRAAWLPQVSTSPPESGQVAKFVASPAVVSPRGATVTLSFSAPGATNCSVSSSPALWSWVPQGVPCTGTLQMNVSNSPVARSWQLTFQSTWPGDREEAAEQTVTQFSPAPPTANPSQNWSGYVVPSNGPAVTEVSGGFSVPTLDCADTPTGNVGVWVGLGGVTLPNGQSSGALLQTGVDSSCIDGVQSNVGWWELWPSTPNYTQLFAGFPVTAGDTMEASVFQQPDGAWETLLSDNNTGLSGVMITGKSWGVGPTTPGTVDYTSQGSAKGVKYHGGYTAEWIIEDTANLVAGGFYQFADFGAIAFDGLSTSLGSWGLTPPEAYAIEQQGVELAAPSAVSSGGFTLTYYGP